MSYFTDIWAQLRELYERRLEPEYLTVLAEGYWKTLLVSSVAVLIGIVAFGAWQFVAVLEDFSAAQSASGNVPPVALDRMKLESLLAQLNARTDAYTTQSSNATIFNDPSK